MKKAVYFTLDAMFATILIGFGLVLLTQNFISETSYPQLNYYSQDIIAILSSIKVSELDDPYIKSLISNGEITYLNNSIIEQIGEFYVLNKTDSAQNLSRIISENLIPTKFGFEILINNDTVYFVNKTEGKKDLVSARRLISGIEKFKPIRGATSKVFLESIQRKKYSSYLYFGGFIGQGNISGFTENLPSGVNITNLYMEVDAGSDFSLFINNDLCDNNLTSGTGVMTSDAYDLSYCNDSLVPGDKNNFTIVFNEDLDNAYIGGGFIRVDYFTDELYQEPEEYVHYEYLPEIQGIVNLYSSFYVPGELNNISVFLHYYVKAFNETNNTFYLTIGNSTVYRDSNLTGEKNHTITLENITKYMLLSSLDRKTVPIRAGFENVSFGYIYEGNADVALVTDVSGSMAWEMDSTSNGDLVNCDNSIINTSDSSRISVAKCLDKDFSRSILNISGNQVGLISYRATTDTADTVNPTTTISTLDSTIGISDPISGYYATGGTCICCGINSAKDILISGITRTIFINAREEWKYNNFNMHLPPPNDNNGNNWYDFTYINESDWNFGYTILGSTNGYVYSPTVTTELGTDLSGNTDYPNLWEHVGDIAGSPADFSSGILNYTDYTTFGITGDDDGWDYASGEYDYSGNVRFDEVSSGMLRIYTNRNSQPVSGAYGIKINITDEMYDIINSENGKATISFNYWWSELGTWEDYEDQIWVKGRWTSPNSGEHYLGEDLDASTSDPDLSYEIDVRNDPDDDIVNEFFSQEISGWVESTGFYYLDFGGKVLADDYYERGYFYFDNIELKITNSSDNYYFRKNFTVSDLNQVEKGILNVLSDDYASVYLNGEKIDTDLESHEAESWNRRGINIPQNYFRQGNNVIAVKLTNEERAAKFDLELAGLDDSRDKAMMVMTDGQANYECTPYQYSTTQGLIDAVDSACNASSTYGITIYAVGYSDDAYEETLQDVADCGNGLYVKSDNATVLNEFYQDVASTIVSASRHSQTIEIEGNITSSILYGDSFIKIGYIPISEPSEFAEISIIVEEKNFDNCSFEVDIPADIRVSDAKLTSYSSEHWTDALLVNGIEVYNLSRYSENYGPMGDPFLLNIPVDLLQPGTNTFFIRTGDSPENYTECSLNNTLIYTSQITASVSYSDVLEKAEGCEWQVEFEDGGFTTIDVPQYYSGSKTCFYTNASLSYDVQDTYDDAMFNLLDNLDFDDDGRIYVNIEEENFIIGAISVGKIPYPWGPAIAEVRVWR